MEIHFQVDLVSEAGGVVEAITLDHPKIGVNWLKLHLHGLSILVPHSLHALKSPKKRFISYLAA